MQKGMPDSKSDEATAGDKIHAALALQKTDGLDIEEVEMFDRCKRIEDVLVLAYFGPEIAALKAFPDREKRQWIQFLQDGGLQHSGQADVVYRYKSKALVIDYKTGRNEVASSPRNMQMRDLAVVNWVNRPLLLEIGVAVIQPWVTEKPDVCAYKLDDIKKSIEHLRARVKASNDPSAPRSAGEDQCKYCRAKTKCPEYQKWASALVPMPDRSLVDVPVIGWSPVQRQSFLDNLGRAEKWLAECKEAMKNGLKSDPEFVPGWTLKDGQSRYSIINAQAVFASFSEVGGTLEQFMECITVGKTKLKEKVAAVTSKKGKSLEVALTGIIGKNIEAKVAEPILAKAKEAA